MLIRRLAGLFFVGLVLALVPASASAQSAIAGVVKDTSGAVMPGVTVEATSPALIEQARSVVTDGQGQYKIVDLRPGVYAITFTLPGFNTVKRDGVELPANFTATINIELRVGALEETVTVSGASPVSIERTRGSVAANDAGDTIYGNLEHLECASGRSIGPACSSS